MNVVSLGGDGSEKIINMKKSQITESEWIIMESLWGASSMTAVELTEELRSVTNWAVNTVRTMLTRLVKKKILVVSENKDGIKVFTPAVMRESCVELEGESFVQRFFGGATKPLLAHFAQHSNLSSADVEELKNLLDQSLVKKS